MSINRDMKQYMLQESKVIRSPSGAEAQQWVDVGEVSVAVYKKNDAKR